MRRRPPSRHRRSRSLRRGLTPLARDRVPCIEDRVPCVSASESPRGISPVYRRCYMRCTRGVQSPRFGARSPRCETRSPRPGSRSSRSRTRSMRRSANVVRSRCDLRARDRAPCTGAIVPCVRASVPRVPVCTPCHRIRVPRDSATPPSRAIRSTVQRNRIATIPIIGPCHLRRSSFVHFRRAKVLARDETLYEYNLPAPGNHETCKGDTS